MIIDAKDAILGRLGSYVAKHVLLGHKVDVVNCEESVVSGKNAFVLQNYIRRLDRKAPGKGPYFYRRPDMFVRRTIRGMLPFKRARGRDAFKNVRCYIGVPDNFKNEKISVLGNIKSEKLTTDYMKVKNICKLVGWKQ